MKDIFESLECNTIFVISSKTGEGFERIKEYLKITLSKMVLPIAIEEQLPVEDVSLFKRIEKLRRLKEEVQTEEPSGASETIDKMWYKNWKNLKF